MLCVDISVVDSQGKRQTASVRAVRGQEHPKFHKTYHYSYRASIEGKVYTGGVLHHYHNGAVALTAKLTRAIVMQQKADRKATQ